MKFKINWNFILILIISLLNGYNNMNINYKYFVYIQLLIVVFFSTKNPKKAFILHLIFMLSSTNFFSDLRLNDINDLKIINYSKLKLFGPISFSYITLSIFFMISLILYKENRIRNLKNKKLKNFFISIYFLVISPILIGSFRIILGNIYSIKHFISNSVYSLNVIIYFFIILSLFNKNDYKLLTKIIKNLLIVSVIYPFILALFNKKGYYGGVTILSTLDITQFACILIFFKGKIAKCSYIIYILCFKFFALGKGIIYFLISFYKYLDLKILYRYKILKILLFILMVCFVLNIDIVLLFFRDKDSIIFYKIRELSSLLKIYNLTLIPHSPKVRIMEIINISYHYLKYPYLFIFGNGFGLYYKDWSNLFSTISLHLGDFSVESIQTRIFYNGHDSFSNIYFYNGIVGSFIVIKYVFYFWKNYFKCPLVLISIFWLGFVFYFNIHIIILGLLCSYLFFINYDFNNN